MDEDIHGVPRAVYFISDGHLIKIGLALDVRSRLRYLQTGNPRRLTVLGVMRCEGCDELEKTLHVIFTDFHVHGEWFRPCPEMHEFIREATSLDDDEAYLDQIAWSRIGKRKRQSIAAQIPADTTASEPPAARERR